MTPITVIAQQPDWLLVNKPAGLDFHDNQGTPGLFSLLQQQSGQRLYPVHRLDKITSGLLLVARSRAACQQLSHAFATRQIEKYYLAISHKKGNKKRGWVIGDMCRTRNGGYRLLRSRNNPAISYFFSFGLTAGRRLYLIRPYSGKTHQIRVALKSIGAPILGDPLYAPAGSDADRAYLHACGLRFNWQGKQWQWYCPPEQGTHFGHASCQQVVTNLPLPWQLAWPSLNDN